eukprot:TRINITY_DN10377_c0_g1_i4.p1 TRINITY_DN10377_c0_g1~~TRINITY_DN10377_c0_g1_i4.p1  ORF type:complete len:653 (+),score=118.99 TRINITY_DN10377_c0_g1_i4:199-2157(+)
MAMLRLALVALVCTTVVTADRLIAVQTPNSQVKVSGADFVTSFRHETANGPFNKPDPFEDCGGYVWATTGNFENAITGLEDSLSKSFGQKEIELKDKDAVAVWFHILPNGTHPWHVHENMDEFVTVMGGSGLFAIIDPEKQVVSWYPCYPGTVMTMPRGFMHMFRASEEGLDLLAYADVQQANLALVPTYISTLPKSIKETVLGKQAAKTNTEGWEWGGDPGSGPAFVCPANSDDVQEYLDQVLETNMIATCNYTIKSSSGESGSCQTDTDYLGLLNSRQNGVGFGILNKTYADCIADGAWCTVHDQLGQTYGRMELQPREMIQAVTPSGYMIAYVTQGSVWVEFYHPNLAYHVQFQAKENDLFYIPMDLFFTIVSTNDTHPVILNTGIRATRQLNLATGSDYAKNRLLPLSLPLRSFRFPLAGAVLFSNGSRVPHTSISFSEQRAAYESSEALSGSIDNSQPIATGDMAIPLVHKMSESTYAEFQTELSSWDNSMILCTETNVNCGIEMASMTQPHKGEPRCSPYGATNDNRCNQGSGSTNDLMKELREMRDAMSRVNRGGATDEVVGSGGANTNTGTDGGDSSGYSTGQLVLVGAICGLVSGMVVAGAGFAAFRHSKQQKQKRWSSVELGDSLLDQPAGEYQGLPKPESQ